jgi:hypothetical protein
MYFFDVENHILGEVNAVVVQSVHGSTPYDSESYE